MSTHSLPRPPWSTHSRAPKDHSWEVWSHPRPGPHPRPLWSTHSRAATTSPWTTTRANHDPSGAGQGLFEAKPRSLAEAPRDTNFIKVYPFAPLLREMSITKDLAIRIDFYTLQRCTTLPTIHDFSSGTGSREDPCSLPKVSSLESVTRPLQSFDLARGCPLRFRHTGPLLRRSQPQQNRTKSLLIIWPRPPHK